ncbi:pilus assembly protein [Aurantimonas sp. MSK8Z-1]|uniref:TadE/TadG family type IV pilus assembly protein n=1 Tax=Mangrovibrevibacter kandeliae TaxID=2968473 RepID=UPI002118DC27|nr:TadE/TadG family type IV pilus assembly protein [Aurantimonas sp. MSK8Z-1]MCW4116322.1 pilus assembly protein [Aurantimonas sp. MSK8Z-1]
MHQSRRSQTARRKLWSFARDGSGATAIEFAILALPFFMVIFATIETGVAMAGKLVLENAVTRVGREVMTGQTQEANLDATDFKARICSSVKLMLDCSKLQIDLRTFDSYSAIPTNAPILNGKLDNGSFCYDPGNASAITVLRVFYEWNWYTGFMQRAASGNGKTLFEAMAAFMNEPFGSVTSTKATCS